MPQTIDTSIYGTLTPPQAPNPLQTLGTAASTINAINQNRLFGQTFAARQAIGQAYQQATNPKTGEVDTNKLMGLVANNPNAAFMAGDVAQQALARKQAQLQVQTQQINLGLTHAKAMAGFFGQMVANPNLSMKDITSNATEMVSQGLISPQEAAAEFQNIPGDAAGQKQWALSHYQRYMALQGQLSSALPKPQVVDAGGQHVVIDMNPVTNPGITNTRIVNSLSPGEAAEPTSITVQNPDGSYTVGSTTRAQFANAAHRLGVVPTAPPLTKAGLTPSEASTPVGTFQNGQPGVISREHFAEASMPGAGASGAPATSALQSRGAVGEPATPSPVAPNGFMPTGPKLGAEAAANVAGHESAQQGVDLQKAADTVPQQKAILGNLEAALNNFTSGPGADWSKVAKSFVNANTESAFGTNIFDPKSIASQDEFAKQAQQLAQQQFQTLGGTGTDAKLESTMHTSPNEFLSELGNRGIIALLKGNADAVAVKNREWQAWQQNGHGPDTYGQFSTQFNKEFDPRVFQMVYLSPADRQSMVKGMSKSELAQFRGDVNLAIRDGWIPDPRAQQGAGNGGQ